MADPFLGEIKIFSFAFAPKNWTFCNGQLLPIQQNQALYSLLGAQFGGNGTTNFALPDFRGRVPIHSGIDNNAKYTQGQSGGQESTVLTESQLPTHTHLVQTQSTALSLDKSPSVEQNALSDSSPTPIYSTNANALVALHPSTIKPVGSSQPHNNIQPFLTLNFCIALRGIYPSRS